MADNARRLAPRRSLEGKLAIVSGGSRGIGAAVARNLAAKGCALVLNHTSASSDAAAAALAQELAAAHGVRAMPVRADISTEAGCAAIVAAARGGESELRVDILINNAGVQSKAFLGELKVEEWERVYRINVLGTMLLTQAVLPYLPWDRSGRIVNMSSIVNSQGMVGYSIYGGTKGAIEAMTRVWAKELGERATVNAVNIGPTMTDMYQDIPIEILAEVLESYMPTAPLAKARDNDTDRMKWFAQKLGGRPGYAEEVAGVVAMLCSPDSGWTTGDLVGANGGGRPSY